MGVIVDRFRTTVATSTGNQTFTGDLGGLTPKAAMFIVSLATADGTERDGLSHCIGMADGTTEAAINVTDEHNVATSNTHAAHDNTHCIVIRLDDQTADGSATFVSFGANAVTVNWDDAPSSAWFVDVILFGGSDLSADVTATLLTNTVDTAHDITGPGFEPDLVISITAGLVSSQNYMGVVHNDRASGITQHALFNRHRDARATTENYSKIDDSYGGVSDAGSYAADTNCWLQFSTFDSLGFTVTTRIAAPGSTKYLYTLSLNLGSASPVVDGKVWIYSTPTATGASTDTGPGFEPQFVFYLGSIMEAVDTYYVSTDSRTGSHAYITVDAAAANCSAYASKTNAADSDTETLVNDQIVDINNHDGTALLAATFTGFTATGVGFNWSAVHTSAKKFIGLAIEAEAAGGETVAPSAASFELSITNPAAVLGSVSKTPSASQVELSTTAPTAVLGSVTITPTAASFELSTTAPTVLGGGSTVAPSAAEFELATTVPTAILGSVTITPTAASYELSTTDPTAILGSVTITPTATEFELATTAPSVVLGGQTVTPSAAAFELSSTDPTAVLGSITATPTAASYELSTTDPTGILGSVTVTATAASFELATTAPTVSVGAAGTTVTPSAVTFVLAAIFGAAAKYQSIGPNMWVAQSEAPGMWVAQSEELGLKVAQTEAPTMWVSEEF